MRGKDGTKEWADKMGRITPAYAGKSLVSLGSLSQVWDHPRVCGEKTVASVEELIAGGSPPRMRGKGTSHHRKHRKHGITPAYAGKSCCP